MGLQAVDQLFSMDLEEAAQTLAICVLPQAGNLLPHGNLLFPGP